MKRGEVIRKVEMMKVTAVFTVFFVAVLISASAIGESASIYTWVDEDGVTNYSGRPPDSAPAERTSIRLQRTNPSALQSRLNNESTLDRAKEIREGHEDEQAGEEQQNRQETIAQREENCRMARERLETVSTSQRLYRPLPDGGREYLTDQELDAARADAIATVDEWCGN